MIVFALMSYENLLIRFVFFFKNNINKTNSELTTLFTKMMHFQKMLNQTNYCAIKKIDYLAIEFNSNNNETENETESFNM